MFILPKYSFGIGDRFAQQGQAQLQAFVQLQMEQGMLVCPVWNKSHREHSLVGSQPASTRAAADAATAALGWAHPYGVDADHIRLDTVDGFLPHCNFYTLDLADAIGQAPAAMAIEAFVARNQGRVGQLRIPGVPEPFTVTEAQLRAIADNFLAATEQAALLHQHIAAHWLHGNFAIEVSMDEVATPQTPIELFFILEMLAYAGVPLQTIAPKFTGHFHKGIDYIGDVGQFAKEFYEDVCVLHYATTQFALPKQLKLSVHSGSDKFSLYPIINRVLQQTGAGLHIKTAGTTWLEELLGLAQAGGVATQLVQYIYTQALARYDELALPYAHVVSIDRTQLPRADETAAWAPKQWLAALAHEPGGQTLLPDIRQLLHLAYKIAAEQGQVYLDLLALHRSSIAARVTDNLYRKHMLPLFLQLQPATTSQHTAHSSR